MKNKLDFLPDSDLPIEQEVERNIDNLVSICRARMEKTWNDENEKGTFFDLDVFCIQLRAVFTENFFSVYEQGIQKRRSGKND
jgi:hypothetical protein